MVRDQLLGDKEFFSGRIQTLDRLVEKTNVKIAAGEVNDLVTARFLVMKYVVSLMVLEYSMGASLEAIQARLHGAVRALPPEVDPLPGKKSAAARGFTFTDGTYFTFFSWLCAVAALLEDHTSAAALQQKAREEGVDDFLVDSFLRFVLGGKIERTEKLQFEDVAGDGDSPHAGLREAALLAEGGDAEAAAERLHRYVSGEWYNKHQFAAWHGTHLDGKVYNGYWAFEAAATARVFAIDDSSLNDHKYYPWDLGNTE